MSDYTPWSALKEYGLRRALFSPWTLISGVFALALSLWLPWGFYSLLPVFLTLHVALLGFGITSFGLVFLGANEDFFKAAVKGNDSSLLSLKNLALLMWWPVLLHMVSLVLIVFRLTVFDAAVFVDREMFGYVWRVAYVFFFCWSLIQTYFSVAITFKLVVIKLNWQSKS